MRTKIKIATFLGIICGACTWLGGTIVSFIYASIFNYSHNIGLIALFVILGILGIILTVLTFFVGIKQYKKADVYQKDNGIAIASMFLLLLIPGVMYFCWDPEVDKQIIYVNQKLVKISKKLDGFDDNNKKTSINESDKKINKGGEDLKDNDKNNVNAIINKHKANNIESYDFIKDIIYKDPNIEKINEYYKNMVKSGKITVDTYFKMMKNYKD